MSGLYRIIIALCHSNEVSGTYILQDGTKMYWTEGRSSRFKILYPNGKDEWFDVWTKNPFSDVDADGLPQGVESRIMTQGEEIEWELARGTTLNNIVADIRERDQEE